MMDVLYVAGTLGVGGTERHLSLVLPELARRGWRLEVALLGGDGPFGDPLRNAGISIGQIESPPDLPIPKLRGFLNLRGKSRTLADRLRAAPPRLLHCFLPSCCIVGGWAARTARFGPVAMSRRSQMNRPALFFGDKWLERVALRQADLVFGNSCAVLAELKGEGVMPERLRLVHNGIELAPLPTEADRRSTRVAEGWRDDEVVLVAVANLIPYKGHADILHGLAEVEANGLSNWRLVLVGGGAPQHASILRALAKELNIANRVAFLGPRTDIPRLLAAADVGVLCSHHEGFSNALLEYMSASLPVVATATGGNLDAVEDSKTGRLVPVADPRLLGRALGQIIMDAACRVRMGAAGRAKVEKEFSLDACVTKYEEAYRALWAEHDQAMSRP
ncbi:MAG: glycosyltransferase [Lysobacterales bacterium]|nr:MAG: glycosyltransferase [Xanthomonadales bacterium]